MFLIKFNITYFIYKNNITSFIVSTKETKEITIINKKKTQII